MRRQYKPLAHTAVLVNANHLQRFAAISRAFLAGVTFAAVHVRLNRAAVTGLHILHAFTHRHHLHAQLVTGNDRVSKKRHFAKIA